jgi:hypothetical protein
VVVAAMAAAGIALAQPALGQSADQKLGKVHFSTSCKPAAQTQFDRGMLYQHSFWYRASQKAFEEVLKADPDCAIAYWAPPSACSGIPTPHRRQKIPRKELPPWKKVRPWLRKHSAKRIIWTR